MIESTRCVKDSEEMGWNQGQADGATQNWLTRRSISLWMCPPCPPLPIRSIQTGPPKPRQLPNEARSSLELLTSRRSHMFAVRRAESGRGRAVSGRRRPPGPPADPTHDRRGVVSSVLCMCDTYPSSLKPSPFRVGDPVLSSVNITSLTSGVLRVCVFCLCLPYAADPRPGD